MLVSVDCETDSQLKAVVTPQRFRKDTLTISIRPPVSSLSVLFLLLYLSFDSTLARSRDTQESRLISRILHRQTCSIYSKSIPYFSTYSYNHQFEFELFSSFLNDGFSFHNNITDSNKLKKGCVCYLISLPKTQHIRMRHSSFSKSNRKSNPHSIIDRGIYSHKDFLKLLSHRESSTTNKFYKKVLDLFSQNLVFSCQSINEYENQHLTRFIFLHPKSPCKNCQRENSVPHGSFPRRVQKRNLRSSSEVNSTHVLTVEVKGNKRTYNSKIRDSSKTDYNQRTQSKYHPESTDFWLRKEDLSSTIPIRINFTPTLTTVNDTSTAVLNEKCKFTEEAILCSPERHFDLWQLSAASKKLNAPQEVLKLPHESVVANISDSYNSSFYIPLSTSSSSSPCYLYAVNSSHVGTYGCSTDVLSNFTTSESAFSSLTATEWMRIVAFSLIFIVGVVGNVLVVVTLLHHRNLRTVTNVFLLNLAVADLLLGVFCMPFTLVGSLLQDFVFGSLMCRLIPYMQAVSVSVSVWTLVAISLERFYAICEPLRSRRWQTPSHSYRVIAIVWAASLVFMMPIAILSTLMPVRRDRGRHKCREVWPSLTIERTFNIVITMTLLLVPLIVMAVAYIGVVRALWLGVKIQRSNNSASETSHLDVSTVENPNTNHSRPPDKKSSPAQRTKIFIKFRKVPAVTVTADEANDPISDFNNHCSEESPQSSSLDGEHRIQSPHLNSSREVERSLSRKWWRSTSADRQSFSNLRSSHTERSIMAKRRVVRMLFVLVAEFFICWTPLFIVNLLSLYIPRQVYAALGSIGVSLIQLLAYISSCCNPITYCFMNAKFLQSFKQTFGCAHKRSTSFYSNNANSFRVNYNQVPLNAMLDRNARNARSSQRQRLVHQPNQPLV